MKKFPDTTEDIDALKVKFYNKLLHKNTAQAVNVIAQEFVEYFGDLRGNVDQIARELFPRGRLVSWAGLFGSLYDFGSQHEPYYFSGTFYDKKPRDNEVSEFLNLVIDVIESLPQKKDYAPYIPSKPPVFSESKKPKFTTCFLCWRSVLITTKRETPKLCYFHSEKTKSPKCEMDSSKPIIRSKTTVYRQRNRLREKVFALRRGLSRSVPKPFPNAEGTTLLTATAATFHNYIAKEGVLPHVGTYLSESGMPLESLQDIARALEASNGEHKVPELEQSAWEFYFSSDCHGEEQRVCTVDEDELRAGKSHFYFLKSNNEGAREWWRTSLTPKTLLPGRIFSQLLLAEAWLQAEESLSRHPCL